MATNKPKRCEICGEPADECVKPCDMCGSPANIHEYSIAGCGGLVVCEFCDPDDLLTEEGA